MDAVIIDDELSARKVIKKYLENFDEINLVGEASSVIEGVELISESPPDLVFLDIQMQDGLGFEVLKETDRSFSVIFVSAFAEHALKAHEFKSSGYLLKPLDPDEFSQVVNNVLDSASSCKKPAQLSKNNFGKLSITAVDGIYFLDVDDIVRFESSDNYTRIFLKNDENILASKTIKQYDALLSQSNFFRVHKSHLINLNFMKKFVKGDRSYIVMRDEKRIEVSRRRRGAFIEQLRAI